MSASDPRPASDVSAGVGLAGLAGLCVWIVVCREWASVADLLNIPGPRTPLSGPYAALAAVLFSALPMVAWSLLIEKVHRRASTGIDWSRPRALSAAMETAITKLAGLWAAWGLIAALYFLARWYWQGQYLFAMEVLSAAAPLLLAGSLLYVPWLDRVLVNPRDGAWHFGAMLIGREAYDPAHVRHHLRGWAVKGFFTAFMISILPPGFALVVQADFAAILGDPVQLATLLMEAMFVVDVQIAMVGYLLTCKPLDAHIRSANPHLDGWLAALICYPPFILMGQGGPLDYHPASADWAVWLGAHPTLLWTWGAALVTLTAIYAWATVAFGLRFSNLTYRGVLTNGPYAFTRHPAYLSKNAFWWLSTLPFLTTGTTADAIRNTAILALVSAVYWWRAKTEERHLAAEDAKYREYWAWMARNAVVTRAIERLRVLSTRRARTLQPAE
ncbi:isoprenylcysteine carboxylmethyltransferase family protein [Novosphingobium sp. Gsoil 351]|uniref:methyltransferase family protein n=1 Tax=Novosphingobium sp. Gsoil 351 TaxID=2675225 RepID=UPI0012B4F242|nr:isoprenylcysteine carboxylmethyltransferase family protein [Novosphingobium sp. Gsoil 351]QGN54380.1 protein-S-isoprenylcysteine methyltransferase [Novosphingobium sp. Gsoil 351]